MLLLLSTYGLRDGEITRLRLEDIDWRAETLHIRHSKTGASSKLPLMAEVGEALLNYLRRGRPNTGAREIFIRARAASSSPAGEAKVAGYVVRLCRIHGSLPPRQVR